MFYKGQVVVRDKRYTWKAVAQQCRGVKVFLDTSKWWAYRRNAEKHLESYIKESGDRLEWVK